MTFLAQNKTNWKYILIVLILAILVGGGILYCYLKFQEIKFLPIKPVEEIAIVLDKTDYEQGEEVKAELSFEGVIYEWGEYGWSIQRWEEGSWKDVPIKRGCQLLPDCQSVDFEEIKECLGYILCERPMWYKVEKEGEGEWRAKWIWNQTKGVEKSYKCRKVEDGGIVEEMCMAFEQVPTGKYKIRFEYALAIDPNDPFSRDVNIKYTEKEFTIKEKIEEISCISIDENLDLEKTKEIKYPFADPETFEHIKKEYWIGKGKFKPFEKTEYTMELRVYNKDEEIMKTYSSWLGTSLWCFSFNNNKYVILRTFTGGAHCCAPNYIFSITPTNELKFIKNIETELDEISLSSLVFRNGKLYIRIRDSRFEYFFGSHPSAFYVDEHFLIDEEKVSLDNSEFKKEYVKKAEEKTKDCFEVKNWEEQAPILCIGELVVNYLLAGEEKIAWETVEKFFTEFPDIKDNFGNKIMLEDFKKEIEERLARTVFY